MQYGQGRGPKTSQWLSNMLLRSDDINDIGLATYGNLTDMLVTLADQQVLPEVIRGLGVEIDTAMTVTLTSGVAVSFDGSYVDATGSWGFVANAGSPFGVWVPVDTQIAFDDGTGQGGNPRIDTLEIRPVQVSYDAVPRRFKDPVTGGITTTVVNTRREYDFEFQILKGVAAASPVAPSSTAGWIKVAEVTVADGQTVLSNTDVVTHRHTIAWVTDVSSVYSQEGEIALSSGLVAKYAMESLEGIDSSGNGFHAGENLLGPQYKYSFDGSLENEGKQASAPAPLEYPASATATLPVFDSGLNGQAMRFRDAGDYLVFPESAAGSISTSFRWSLSVWVKLETLAVTDGYIIRLNEITPAGSITLYWNGTSGAFSANIFDGTTTSAVIAAASSGTTEWTHLLLAYDGTNLFLYVDSELVDEVVDGTTGVTPDGGFIGGDGAGTNGFDGLIDEIKIYWYELDEEQRNILYTTFDREVENVGGIAGRGVTFKRLEHSIFVTSPGAAIPLGSAGVQSVSMWVRSEEAVGAGTYSIAFFYRNAGNRFYVLKETATGDLGVSIGDPFAVTTLAAGGTHEGDWHHIVLIRDSINQAFSAYYDGNLVIDSQAATIADLIGPGFYIGNGSAPSAHWGGAVDEVRVYDRRLSPREVHELFTDPAGEGAKPEIPREDLIASMGVSDDVDGFLSSSDVDGARQSLSLDWVWTWAQQVGTDLNIAGAGIPAITALNGTDVAYIDALLQSLRTYRFNGSTWSLVGSGLSVAGVGNASMTRLNSTDIAFIDATNKDLRTYRFNGSTWSQVGSDLNLAGVGTLAITSLNRTDIALVDSTAGTIQAYRFDGSTWAALGSSLVVDVGMSDPAITTLNATDVVFVDANANELKVYRFNGSAWGSVGLATSTGLSTLPAITALNATDIAHYDTTGNTLLVYRFDGRTWSEVSAALSITGTDYPTLTSLNGTDVAFFDLTNDDLRVYRFNWMPRAMTPYTLSRP